MFFGWIPLDRSRIACSAMFQFMHIPCVWKLCCHQVKNNYKITNNPISEWPVHHISSLTICHISSFFRCKTKSKITITNTVSSQGYIWQRKFILSHPNVWENGSLRTIVLAVPHSYRYVRKCFLLYVYAYDRYNCAQLLHVIVEFL